MENWGLKKNNRAADINPLYQRVIIRWPLTFLKFSNLTESISCEIVYEIPIRK